MSSNLSTEQLARRLAGITATDIAAIVGVHPYRSAVDVFLDKIGKSPAFEGNERTKWGNLLEKPIRRDYEERHGVLVEVPGTLEHPVHAWQIATPDGLVYAGKSAQPERGLEIKCHTVHLAHLYGVPGSDEIPPYELCQCTWNMVVTGLPRWDLVAFIDGQTTDYVIHADPELIAMLVERAERFLVDHVRTGEPPPPDGSNAYTDWLKRTHPDDNALASLVPVDDDANVMLCVGRLREIRDEINALESEESTMEQAIKLAIGDHAGIEFPGRMGRGKQKRDKITWRKAADSTTTLYQAAVEEVRGIAALVASGKASEFQRALVVLEQRGAQQFENSRATIAATEIRELIATCLETLTRIAKIEPATVPVVGSRRFVVPRWWKSSAPKSDS